MSFGRELSRARMVCLAEELRSALQEHVVRRPSGEGRQLVAGASDLVRSVKDVWERNKALEDEVKRLDPHNDLLHQEPGDI